MKILKWKKVCLRKNQITGECVCVFVCVRLHLLCMLMLWSVINQMEYYCFQHLAQVYTLPF